MAASSTGRRSSAGAGSVAGTSVSACSRRRRERVRACRAGRAAEPAGEVEDRGERRVLHGVGTRGPGHRLPLRTVASGGGACIFFAENPANLSILVAPEGRKAVAHGASPGLTIANSA